MLEIWKIKFVKKKRKNAKIWCHKVEHANQIVSEVNKAKGLSVLKQSTNEWLSCDTGMSWMEKSSASPCFLKTFSKMAFQTSSHSNQMTRHPPAPQGSVPDQARAHPEDLRAVTATNATVLLMMALKALWPWRLDPMGTFPRELFHSVPIPKRLSNWLICFCWCVHDWSFWKRTGGAENWELTRYPLLNCTGRCGECCILQITLFLHSDVNSTF